MTIPGWLEHVHRTGTVQYPPNWATAITGTVGRNVSTLFAGVMVRAMGVGERCGGRMAV